MNPLIQTAKYWTDHFTVGLTFEGKNGDEWLWSGEDKLWVYLDWIENGLTGDELQESMQHFNDK